MENQYYIWVDGGVTSVGVLNSSEKIIENPYMIVNMQYTVTEDGGRTGAPEPLSRASPES